MRSRESSAAFRVEPGAGALADEVEIESRLLEPSGAVVETGLQEMRELRRAREIAMEEIKTSAAEMGANAVVGIDLDYETVGTNASMLMVTISGTAVVVS